MALGVVLVGDFRSAAGGGTHNVKIGTNTLPLPEVYRNDIVYTGGVSFLMRLVSHHTLEWQKHMLQTGVTGRVIVDVGTFDGADFTIPAAQAGHKVYSFEPTANKHAKIQQNIINGSVTFRTVSLAECAAAQKCTPIRPGVEGVILLQAAASSTTDMAQFAETPNLFAEGQPRDETGFYGALDMLVGKNSGHKFIVNVPQVRLDEIIDEDIYILKVDAQGFDGAVLKGAERLFANGRVTFVMLEFWPAVMETQSVSGEATLDFLGSYGFVCFDMQDDLDHGMPLNFVNIEPLNGKDFVHTFPSLKKNVWGPGPWTELLCANKRFFAASGVKRRGL